ncbi:Ribonuclease P/MRP protein subunit [Kalmanozyma brasiliensis GHG001]|uniref:Uncharacterized protein n=1 Tax=Kalmanozyma brasiliensis (strain GHG001) TaxID=1365824 RepID=V5EKY6_KALBG|nr:Ribonuclease P/MRP protein subunit [Kalmanozyma brasiliensis GHG001]EST05650.1 Ribonuclease P/MRP protein subunit [Kalmanozyma brasiliensis GHG001]
MVRFKTRWLLIAIDDTPLAASSPFPTIPTDDSAHASTSASVLSAARQVSSSSNVAKTITPQHITRLLRASLVYNFGDVAAGAFGGVLTCKYYSSHTGTAIVRCSRDAARLVWASATMISSPIEMAADGEASSAGRTASLRIRVIHCGGTIKKVQNKAIELDRKMIMRLRSKQRKLAAGSKARPSAGDVKTAASTAEVVAPVTAVPPVNALDEDEDLGEALDPGASGPGDPAPTIAAPSPSDPKVKVKGNESTIDPETQALLAQSRKQINSITV